MKERFKLIPAVHLLLVCNSKILLLRRYKTGYEDGNYSVPAGHLDGDESVKTAMAREVKEEACILVRPTKLQVVHVMHRNARPDSGMQNERVDFFLTAAAWRGEPKIGEPDKCDDLSWFQLNRLPYNMVSYVAAAIKHYREGVLFSEFGW